MKLSLEQALKSLDPQNAEHWTAEGLPRVETVQLLTGDADHTRAAITSFAPMFTQGNPFLGEPEEEIKDPDEIEGLTSIVTAEIQPIEVEVEITDEAKLDGYSNALSALYEQRDELNKVIREIENERDKLVVIMDSKITGSVAAATVQGYLASQRAILEKRGATQKAIASSGVDLGELAKAIAPAPIDASRKRRP